MLMILYENIIGSHHGQQVDESALFHAQLGTTTIFKLRSYRALMCHLNMNFITLSLSNRERKITS